MNTLPPVSPDSPAATFTPVERRGVNVAQFLHQTAARLPSNPAVIDPERHTTWSWAELSARVRHTASVLHTLGVRRRDTVMLLSPNCPQMIQAFWAILHIGGVVAPPNAKLTPTEIAALARVTSPAVIIAHESCSEAVAAILAEGVATEVCWISDTSAEHAAVDGAEKELGYHVGTHSADVAAVAEDDPSWYFFTSGSTGAPKAAVFTHRHLGIVLMNHCCDLFPGEDHRGSSLVLAPISHGAGIHLLAQAFTGCASVLATRHPFDGQHVWELIDRHQVTNMFTVPTILNRIVNAYPGNRGPADHTLRHVVYAGAPLMDSDQAHALERLGPCLVQYFGLGEVTGAITVLRPAEHRAIPADESGIGTCGRARTGIEITIQGEDGEILQAGFAGEVCVAGPTVCAGYLNNEPADAEAFAGGWFHTGDIGKLNSAGYLYLTGRKSDMYISGGSNIYPREIEEVLLTHRGVTQAAVIGIPDKQWGEKGVAVVEVSDSTTVDDLKHHVATQLASYKIPKQFRIIREMPITAYGKIARKEIKAELITEENQ